MKKKIKLGDRRKCDLCGKVRLVAYINRLLEEYLCAECECAMGWF